MITLHDQQLAGIRSKVRAFPDDWRTLPLPPNVGLWEWRPQSGTVCFSPAWADLLGIDHSDQAVNLGEYTRWVHPDDRPLLTLTMVGYILGTGEYLSQHRMVRPDGHERLFLSRDVLVCPVHGHRSCAIVADFDLTGASC
jgi:PAS domain-containing protein